MSKCFWSYNCRRITTVQQHENFQLIVASQVDQLWQHVATHSNHICPPQQTTVAKYLFHRSRGDRQTEDFLAMDAAVWMRHCPKTETRGIQDQDQDSEVPRPRPRLEGFKTKTETKTCKNESRDQNSSLENSKSAIGTNMNTAILTTLTID